MGMFKTDINKTANIRLIFSGGGTGGHIYPAIAVANKIMELEPSSEILFVGAKGKLEMAKVPQAGYSIIGLWISGLHRRLTLSNLTFPLKVLHSFVKSWRILKGFKPHAIAGFGGFASGPIMLAATAKGIKTLIQEQNSFAGITNRSIAKKVDRICVAYDHMNKYFPKEKILITGNPVRSDIMNLDTKKNEGEDYFSLDPGKETILILGGSGGARTINEGIIRNIEDWLKAGVQLLWQTGRFYHKEMKQKMAGYDDQNVRLLEFIDRMDLAYAVADIVISRAGALSISELCLVKKPVIFVPSPNVAEDHQTKNAMALYEKNAALIVEDKNAVKELVQVATGLLKDTDRRILLSENISALGKPLATDEIAQEVLKLVNTSDESKA